MGLPKGRTNNKKGRPKKADEERTTELICLAIKELSETKLSDQQARVNLIKRMLQFDNGVKWCAEKIFGKPVEQIDMQVTEKHVVDLPEK